MPNSVSPWSDLETASSPRHFAHRGASLMAPENTLPAFRLADQLGAQALEMDVYLTQDSLAVMHDTTVNRTTNLTGSQATQLTAAAMARGRIDAGNWFCNTWPNDIPIPQFSDVLDEIGGHIPIIVHCNNVGSGAPAVEQILRQELGDSVLIMGWGESELVAARAVSIPTCLLSPTGILSGQTYDGLLDAGTMYLGVDASQTSAATMNAIMDSGLRLMVYTVNSRTVAQGLPGGVWAILSDDPWYVSGDAPLRSRDLFSAGTFDHGMVGIPDVQDYRGAYTVGAPSWWGLDGTATGPAAVNTNGGYISVLHGYLGPQDDSFTLDCDLVLDAIAYSTASAQVMLSVGDTPYDDQGGGSANPDGYNILLRGNGVLDLYSVTSGVTTHLGTVATGTVTLGAVQHLRITVTPTQLTVARTNVATPNALTVTSDTYRGDMYPHLGVRGAKARWANVIVS